MTAFDPKPERQRVVLVVTHYYGAHGGGVERVADRLIREMTAFSNRYHFSWAASGTDPKPEGPSLSALPMRTFNLLERFTGLPWPVWGPASLRRLKRAVAAADIVWLHDTLYPGNLLAFRWARQKKKPVVITQHIGPIPFRNPVLRASMRLADKYFTQNMLRDATQTLFISDSVAEDYYARAGFTKSVKVIPNGVDLRLFNPPLQEKRHYLRQKFALKADQPVLLFVGRFVEKKGLAAIRHLAGQLPDWRFWMAGRGPIDPAKWLLPNVHVFRDRADASLAELYHTADLLILPSYGEGFPLVVQEALACGLPAMCSPATAAGSLAARPVLHLADVWPDDPLRTANVWAEKLKNFPLRLPLSTSQYDLADFAQMHWDWGPIAEAYTETFREVC